MSSNKTSKVTGVNSSRRYNANKFIVNLTSVYHWVRLRDRHSDSPDLLDDSEAEWGARGEPLVCNSAFLN